MSPSKKRHTTELQDDLSNISPRKKRTLKTEAEEMDESENQESQASTVLYEFDGHDMTTNNPGDTSAMKVERNENAENAASNNCAEANEADCKSFNLGNTSNVKMERNQDAVNPVLNNGAEANATVDCKASSLSMCVSELGDTTINEASTSKKKKKKKKKDRELEDTVAEEEDTVVKEENTVLEENTILEENTVLEEEENSTETKKKKKKKKKKKHRENNSAEEDEHMNNETRDEEVDEETELSFEAIKRMFEDIHQKLISDKNVIFTTFWDTYKFHPYSTKKCKIAFENIMLKVNKKRNLLELVNAAGEMLKETPSIFYEKNMKQLKPVTPFKLFSQSHYKKILEKHPEYKGIHVLNKITKKWKRLSDHKKLKYIDMALANKTEYMEAVKEYKKIDPTFVAKPILNKVEWHIKDRCADLPDVPPRNGFNLFLHKSSGLYLDMSQKERQKKLSADFKLLPAEVKEKFNSQVKEQRKVYDELLKTYLENLSPSDLEERTLTNKTKKSKSNTQEQIPPNFLQKKPPMSGYMLFFKELKGEIKGSPTLMQASAAASEKWKTLSKEKRLEYNKRRLILHEEWHKEIKSQIKKDPSESTSNDG